MEEEEVEDNLLNNSGCEGNDDDTDNIRVAQVMNDKVDGNNTGNSENVDDDCEDACVDNGDQNYM